MNEARRVRLLRLATTPNANHKRWYSSYCELMGEGLCGWRLGTAYLTSKGQEYLVRSTLSK